MPNQYMKDIDGLVVDIAGVFFEVTAEKDMIERFGMQGQIDFRNNLIVIDPDMGDRDTLTVLIHEIIEGIIRRYQVSMPHEQIVFLECSLFTVLMNNPRLLEIILKEARNNGKEHKLSEATSIEEYLNGETGTT